MGTRLEQIILITVLIVLLLVAAITALVGIMRDDAAQLASLENKWKDIRESFDKLQVALHTREQPVTPDWLNKHGVMSPDNSWFLGDRLWATLDNDGNCIVYLSFGGGNTQRLMKNPTCGLLGDFLREFDNVDTDGR